MSKKIRDALISMGLLVSGLMTGIIISLSAEALNVSKTENLQLSSEAILFIDTTKSLTGGLAETVSWIDVADQEVFDFLGVENAAEEYHPSICAKMIANDKIEDVVSQEENELLLSKEIVKCAKRALIEEEENRNKDRLAIKALFESLQFTETNDTVYSTTGVNVRALPDTNSERVGYLSFNQQVTRVGNYDNGWSKIIYENEEFYVKTSYLSKNKQTAKINPNKSGNYPVQGPHEVPEGTVPCYTHGISYLTQDEYDTLLILAMSEAGGASYDCVVACVETVLNRMASGKYGDFWSVLDAYYLNYKKVPNQKCIDAVNQTLRVQTYPSNLFYFRTKYYHSFGTPYMSIDNVYFSLGKL